MSPDLVFDVFGRQLAVQAQATGWAAFHLGPDGKRRPANIVIPDFIEEHELAQYLADLFHEAATGCHDEVRRIA